MPQRPFSRSQVFLIPPSLDDGLPPDHPARFVAALLDELDAAQWAELGVNPRADSVGAPRYAPQALTARWVYGFMSGVRSTRDLEVACRDQVPFRWLGGNQTPDHNTLWRFYQAHRQGMRGLLPHTVRIAVRAGLVDWALQAVDGTKLAANAARDRSLAEPELTALLARMETALDALEAHETQTEESGPPRLPPGMRAASELRARVRAALAVVTAADGPRRANVTDPEANLMQTRQGIVPAYNAQAVVVPVVIAPDQPGARLITAVRTTAAADDHGALAGLIAAAAEITGALAQLTTADGGFHDGPSLRAGAALGAAVALPEAQTRRLADPYHKNAFAYDGAADVFTCPQGQPLTFRGARRDRRGDQERIYAAPAAICAACPVNAACLKERPGPRRVTTGPYETELRAHRAWMRTEPAQTAKRRRGALIEGVFGILKERQRGRRLLLRGLEQAAAEWSLLATGFNLRTLWRWWKTEAARLGAVSG